MKTLQGLTFTLVMILMGSAQTFAQDSTETDECAKWRGLYFQYLKQGMYRDAGTMWGKGAAACGEDGLDAKFFTNGRVIYMKLLREYEENEELRKGVEDTLKWIYETRPKYEKDPEWDLDYAVLLRSLKDDRHGKMDSLFENVHVLKSEAKSSAIRSYYIHLILNKFNEAPAEEKDEVRAFIIEEYIKLSAYCTEAIEKAEKADDKKDVKRYKGAQQFLDKYFLKIAKDCADLTGVLEKKLSSLPEEKEARKEKVEKFLALMDQKQCSKSETYGKYVDELISIEPTAEAYYFGARNQEENGNMDKALEYYEKAVELEGDGENKDKYLFSYTNALYKTGSYKSAFSNAKQVEGENKADALMIAAGCIVRLANSCGESTFMRNANYWLANDYVNRAIAAGKTGVSSSKYLDNAPDQEEIFTEGKSVGESITLSCWGESTTIR